MPVEAVFLLGIGDGLVAHELLEHVEIHRHAVRSLGDEFREERPKRGEVRSGEVGGLGFGVGGGEWFHVLDPCFRNGWRLRRGLKARLYGLAVYGFIIFVFFGGVFSGGWRVERGTSLWRQGGQRPYLHGPLSKVVAPVFDRLLIP